jgi:4-amino-4-deoxy-L-arabinose transferase-like glycosyltransferase
LARHWFLLACPAIVAPGLLWACLDYRPWPWDQAQYAEYTLRTLAAFSEGPIAGIASMGVLMGVKAPGLTWFGIPFATLANLYGRPEPALLCATLTFQMGTLLSCYWSAYLVSRSRLTSLAAAAFIGATPIFIAMNHQYLVEPLQTLAVALSFLLALCARDMSRVALFVALCAVTALAMAAKSTSPLYCTLPLVFAASVLVTHRSVPPAGWLRALGVPLVLLAVFGLALVINWYATHFSTMLENARQSTVGSLALSYGTRGDFPAKLSYWISAFASALFFPSLLVLLAAGLTACAVMVSRRQAATDVSSSAAVGLVVGAAALHLAAAFIAYSVQINEDPRFLEPLLPATAILLAWFCSRRWLFAAPGALLASALAQFLLAYGYALGLSPKAADHPYLLVVERDDTKRRQLQMAVELTCDAGRPYDVNLVGVQYAWLSASSANFYAVVAHGGRAVCRYISLELPGEAPDTALRKLHQLAHQYYVSVVPEKMPSPPDFVNLASAEAFAKVAHSADWEHVRTIDHTIVIFRSKRY